MILIHDPENLQTVISKIDDGNFRNLFKLLFQKRTEKVQQNIQLTNRVEDLEKRVLLQERYSSKDSLIVSRHFLLLRKNARL